LHIIGYLTPYGCRFFPTCLFFASTPQVDAVTLAVGNTMKRVFIIVASVIVFGNQVSTASKVGSTIGIGGVLLYSLTKMKYEKLEATKGKN